MGIYVYCFDGGRRGEINFGNYLGSIYPWKIWWQVLSALKQSGLVKAKAGGYNSGTNFDTFNNNSDNWSLVKACIIAGLYPNIARSTKYFLFPDPEGLRKLYFFRRVWGLRSEVKSFVRPRTLRPVVGLTVNNSRQCKVKTRPAQDRKICCMDADVDYSRKIFEDTPCPSDLFFFTLTSRQG